RCPAFALTGVAARTDPVCALSPDHGLVTAAVAGAAVAGTSSGSGAEQPALVRGDPGLPISPRP
ncbi:MAG: hypothetical protein ACRDOI_00190, partial [Trebonia sp.]